MNIKELAGLQKELDSCIVKGKNLGEPYDIKFLEKRKLALLVEIGELANSTRCFKYWSNKEPEPKEVILEEAADCLHFTLSLIILDDKLDAKILQDIDKFCFVSEKWLKTGRRSLKTEKIFNNLFELASKNEWVKVLTTLLGLIVVLGYTEDELEQAYLEKHKKNHKRQEEGY